MTTIQLTIERTDPDGELAEIDIEVTGTLTRYRPATRLDPEDGGEVEDIEATWDGEAIELTQTEMDRAWEDLARQAREDAEEARDRAADEWRDSQMERDLL